MSALEAVHSALKGLSAEDRQRVLSSVHSLLDIDPVSSVEVSSKSGRTSAESSQAARTAPTRGVGLVEVIKDKEPRSIPQMITLFAYYREKYEGRMKFGRDDLEQYFTKAHEPPPGNFHRDFVIAVRNGWIHDDGENSYITSKGIEAVESGFAGGEGKPRSRSAKTTRSAKRARK